MGRAFDFPTFMQFADLCLFVSSWILAVWIQTQLLDGLPDESKVSREEYDAALF